MTFVTLPNRKAVCMSVGAVRLSPRVPCSKPLSKA